MSHRALSPQQFWHVTSPVYRKSIQQGGLRPLAAHEPVWGWTKKSRALTDAGWRGDIWEVQGHPSEHASGTTMEWRPEDPVHVSYETPVPPSRIRLVRKGGRPQQ